jgi:hypothetical protein
MAAMGTEIGRISIKVVPDLKGFRTKVKDELKGLPDKEPLKVRADTDQMEKDIEKGLKKASKDAVITPTVGGNKARFVRRMQSQLNKLMNDIEVSLNFKGPDNQALREYWDKQEKYFQKLLLKITPEMDIRSFSADAAWINATLNKMKMESRDIRFTPMLARDLARSNGELEDGLNKIQQQSEELRRLAWAAHDASVATDKVFENTSKKDQRQALREIIYGYRDMAAAIENVNRREAGTHILKGLEQEVTRITEVFDQQRMRGGILGFILGGMGAVAGAKEALATVGAGVKGIGTAAKNAADSLKGLSPQGLGLNVSTAGFLVIAGAITAIAAPLAGLLTTAMLTLPGVLATVMAPIAAVVLGFGGIKKAAEEAGLFGDKNGEKKGGGSLGEKLKELQTETEKIFSENLKEPFARIGNVAGDYVKPLTDVAKGVADVMADVINTVTSPEMTTKISATFSSIGKELSNSFGPGIADFTEALINLAHQFTTGGALEGVGKWFRETMADFKEWTSKKDFTEQFKQLGDTLRIVLELIGDIAGKGLDFVGDPSKMASFKDSLQGLADILKDIVGLSKEMKPVWDLFAAGTKLVTDPLNKFKDVINNPGSLDKWNELGKSLTNPGGAAAKDLVERYFGNPEERKAAAASAGQDAAAAYQAAVGAALAQNQEMFSEQPWALGATGLNDQITNQITTQAQTAIDGARQALVPLQEGLQTDINNALMPLGEIAGKVSEAFGEVPALVEGSLGQIPGIVQASMGTLATEAQTAMQGLSDAVIEHCAIAVNTATSEAPKVAEPFKALAGQMSAVGADMMAGLGQGISSNVGIAKAAAERAAAEVLEAAKAAVRSKSPSKDFMELGGDLNKGLAIGIDDSAKGPISAIRQIMLAIKDVFGSAEGLNLNFYFGQMAESMNGVAAAGQNMSKSLGSGVGSRSGSSGGGGKLSMEARQQIDVLSLEQDKLDVIKAQLKLEKNSTDSRLGKASIQQKMDEIDLRKKNIDLQKEEIEYQSKYFGGGTPDIDWKQKGLDLGKIPFDFASATGNQFLSDLGVGGGAITAAMQQGLEMGSKFIFNVANLDDAMYLMQNQQNKDSLNLAGR